MELVSVFLTPIIRHGLTALAGALVTHSLLNPNDAGAFAHMMEGIASGGIGLAWSFIKNHQHAVAVKPAITAAK